MDGEGAEEKWANLPWNLVSGIMEKLSLIDDYVRFGAVCSSWHTAFIHDKPSNKRKHSSIPFLLVPHQEEGIHNKRRRDDGGGSSSEINKKTKLGQAFGLNRCVAAPQTRLGWCEMKKAQKAQSRRSLYSVGRDMVYQNYHVHFPAENICRGSSYGWLVVTFKKEEDGGKYSVQLLNPFLPPHADNNIIHLPPLPLPDIDEDKLLPYAYHGVDDPSDEGEEQEELLLSPFHEDQEEYDFFSPPNAQYFLSPSDQEEQEDGEGEEDCEGGPEQDSEIYVHKAVLSAPPHANNNFIVMAILGGFCCLAFYDSSHKSSSTWTPVGDWNIWRYFDDVIFFNKTQQFYAVRHNQGAVFSVALQSVPQQVAPPLQPLLTKSLSFRRYIVELPSGELLQVIRTLPVYSEIKHRLNAFTKFEIHKLDAGRGEWIQIFNLGHYILFLGINASVSRSVSDFPECMPNCIYFTDDVLAADFSESIVGPQAMGIYNLEEGTVHPHFSIDHTTPVPQQNLPIWIEPTLS